MKNKFLVSIVLVAFLFSCKTGEQKTGVIEDDIVVEERNEEKEVIDEVVVIEEEEEAPAKTACLQVIEQILTTSPDFKQYTTQLNERVIANGGKGYGYFLEGSPDPADEASPSETYDFAIFESYEDRNPIVARFNFNLSRKQLLEYDVVEGIYIPHSFDENLLKPLQDNCPCRYDYYYLSSSDGKIYLYNGNTERSELFFESDKRILHFDLSPDQRYLIYTKEIAKWDCNGISSLVLYDVLTGETLYEYGGKKDTSGAFGRWEPAQTFTYALINYKDDIFHAYKYSLKTGETETLTIDEFYNYEEDSPSESLAERRNDPILKRRAEEYYTLEENPYNNEWLAMADELNLILYNAKEKKETEILKLKGFDNKIHSIIWMDEKHFIYSVENILPAQCQYDDANVYLYNIETKENKLLFKNAAYTTPFYSL